MILISVPVAILITVTAPALINLFFGELYSESVAILRIHVWAGLFVSLNNAAWAWYIVENRQKIANVRILIGLALNIVLNLFLIPSYGAIGAAIATIISRAFVAYIGQLFTRPTRVLFFMMTKSLFTCGFYAQTFNYK